MTTDTNALRALHRTATTMAPPEDRISARQAIVNALPALLAYVRELEWERDKYADGVRCPNCDHLRLQLGDQRAAALAMRERCAVACEEAAQTRLSEGHDAPTMAAVCAAAIRALEP